MTDTYKEIVAEYEQGKADKIARVTAAFELMCEAEYDHDEQCSNESGRRMLAAQRAWKAERAS